MSTDQIESKKDEGGEDIGVVVLMLSLYLIVLAFFILLNAISESNPEQEEKVLEGVGESFSDIQISGDGRQSEDMPFTMKEVVRSLSDDLKDVLQTYLSLQGFDFKTSGKHMQAKIKVNKFFEPSSVEVKPEMVGFFEDMADGLSYYWPGLEILTKVTISGVDNGDDNAEISPSRLAGWRATNFVRALAERGAPEDRLSAAANIGTSENIIIDFKVVVHDSKAVIQHAETLRHKLKYLRLN